MRVFQRTEAVKPGEQFVILFRGLGEAETGVEDQQLVQNTGMGSVRQGILNHM